MLIRDALESDANALAELTGRPHDVVLNLIHDRSVRVAVDGGGVEEASKSEERSEDDDVVGFLAFDVRSRTVHVTDFGGKGDAIERLFDEPRRFGAGESMDIEVVVPDADERRIETVENAGFAAVEAGPRFDGRKTTRFRLEIDDGTD